MIKKHEFLYKRYLKLWLETGKRAYWFLYRDEQREIEKYYNSKK